MPIKLALLFMIALVFRLLLVPVAHHGDLNNNISWGNSALARGFNGYYEGTIWEYSAPNQPPLYIVLFTVTSLIFKIISSFSQYLNNAISIFPSSFIWFWDRWGMEYLVKLPGILADLAIGYLIYKKRGLTLATVWIFNPVSWYNSAIWGGTDPIVNLLGFIAILALLEKKFLRFGIFITISILFKASLIIFTPVLIFVAVSQRYSFQSWCKCVIACLITALFITFPFHMAIDLPTWLVNLYQNRILSGEIGSLTANAFNFWWLIDPGKTLDSTIYLSQTAHTWGYVISVAALAAILFFLKKKYSEKGIHFALALSALGTFLFMTRIHERYLYPFFPIATLLVGLNTEIMISYIVLSAIHLLNLYHLFWAPSIPVLKHFYTSPNFAKTLSLATIVIFGYLFYKFATGKK
jgi:Gpi18-like mannosyltransferase